MTEKVLGFKEEDGERIVLMNNTEYEYYIWEIKEADLVPVVSVKALEKFRLKRLKAMLNQDEERVYANGYLEALNNVIEEAVRLQAVEEKE